MQQFQEFTLQIYLYNCTSIRIKKKRIRTNLRVHQQEIEVYIHTMSQYTAVKKKNLRYNNRYWLEKHAWNIKQKSNIQDSIYSVYIYAYIHTENVWKNTKEVGTTLLELCECDYDEYVLTL